jgi:N-acetylmuramoyl-L-alanine amidase
LRAPEARWDLINGGLARRRFIALLATASAGLAVPLASSALAAEPRKPPLRTRLIAIDPGHGGIDPGAIGINGALEKDVTLDAARELARQLEATKRYRVELTRTDDEFVPLQDRVARARAVNAELFISLHADALPDAHMRGATVFTLSEKASDSEAAAVAARENKADLIAGIDLSRHTPEVSEILFDLARRQTNNLSIRLAREVVGELSHRVRLLHNSHRAAGFAVLKAPDIPSALVEMGCLSNREEERQLQQASYQRNLAACLTRSVNDYFDLVGKA